jgi:hypothetical protein
MARDLVRTMSSGPGGISVAMRGAVMMHILRRGGRGTVFLAIPFGFVFQGSCGAPRLPKAPGLLCTPPPPLVLVVATRNEPAPRISLDELSSVTEIADARAQAGQGVLRPPRAVQVVSARPATDSLAGSVLHDWIVADGQHRHAGLLSLEAAERAVKIAERTAKERQRRREYHSWHLVFPRLTKAVGVILIALLDLTVFVTAYLAVRALIVSPLLAIGLAVLAALLGGGVACSLARRRLDRPPVPAAARVLEGIFVSALGLLRYDSLRIQGGDVVMAVRAAALATTISAIGLLMIEEIAVGTSAFGTRASLRWTKAHQRARHHNLRQAKSKRGTAHARLCRVDRASQRHQGRGSPVRRPIGAGHCQSDSALCARFGTSNATYRRLEDRHHQPGNPDLRLPRACHRQWRIDPRPRVGRLRTGTAEVFLTTTPATAEYI